MQELRARLVSDESIVDSVHSASLAAFEAKLSRMSASFDEMTGTTMIQAAEVDRSLKELEQQCYRSRMLIDIERLRQEAASLSASSGWAQQQPQQGQQQLPLERQLESGVAVFDLASRGLTQLNMSLEATRARLVVGGSKPVMGEVSGSAFRAARAAAAVRPLAASAVEQKPVEISQQLQRMRSLPTLP